MLDVDADDEEFCFQEFPNTTKRRPTIPERPRVASSIAIDEPHCRKRNSNGVRVGSEKNDIQAVSNTKAVEHRLKKKGCDSLMSPASSVEDQGKRTDEPCVYLNTTQHDQKAKENQPQKNEKSEKQIPKLMDIILPNAEAKASDDELNEIERMCENKMAISETKASASEDELKKQLKRKPNYPLASKTGTKFISPIEIQTPAGHPDLKVVTCNDLTSAAAQQMVETSRKVMNTLLNEHVKNFNQCDAAAVYSENLYFATEVAKINNRMCNFAGAVFAAHEQDVAKYSSEITRLRSEIQHLETKTNHLVQRNSNRRESGTYCYETSRPN